MGLYSAAYCVVFSVNLRRSLSKQGFAYFTLSKIGISKLKWTLYIYTWKGLYWWTILNCNAGFDSSVLVAKNNFQINHRYCNKTSQTKTAFRLRCIWCYQHTDQISVFIICLLHPDFEQISALGFFLCFYIITVVLLMTSYYLKG